MKYTSEYFEVCSMQITSFKDCVYAMIKSLPGNALSLLKRNEIKRLLVLSFREFDLPHHHRMT